MQQFVRVVNSTWLLHNLIVLGQLTELTNVSHFSGSHPSGIWALLLWASYFLILCLTLFFQFQWHFARKSMALSVIAGCRHLQASSKTCQCLFLWSIHHSMDGSTHSCPNIRDETLWALPLVFIWYTCTNPKPNVDTCAHLIFLHEYVLKNIVSIT